MNMQSASRKSAIVGFSAMTLSMLAFSAQANLIKNGEFSLFTSGGTNRYIDDPFCPSCQGSVLQNWINTGPFAFVFGPGAADQGGASATGTTQVARLWGPNSGAPSHNTFDGYSPNQINEDLTVNLGVNFVAFDADPTFPGRTISQTINAGLVTGQQYVLSYHWAAAQYTDQTGATSSGWGVTLGAQTLMTGFLTGTSPLERYETIQSQGFSGWQYESIPFTYTGPSSDPNTAGQVLSFIAQGYPGGRPPVVLLDSVSLTVPEPASLSLVGVGMLGLIAVGLRRRTKPAVG